VSQICPNSQAKSFTVRVSGGTYGMQGGSRQFYIEVMEGYIKIVWQATPKFFDLLCFGQ
jgi:hypothetical protein